MRALVIEDSPLVAMTIADELATLGFDDVVCAETQEEALRLAQDRCPILVTADYDLGTDSGIEAVRAICVDRPLHVLFIVALADRLLREEPDACVLEKPFSSHQFVHAVRTAMLTKFTSYGP